MKGAGKPKAAGPKGRKERDEDLLLFREMFKREKERNVSLLEPVSSEFESSQGSFPLYKLPSGKKGAGNDFLGADKEKNDYDWLKTPPATPLFPSLEMEANDPSMVFQRELPILQHIKPSRFSAKMEEIRLQQKPKSPSSRSTASTRSESSSRSETPSARPSSSGSTTSLREMMNLKERSNSLALSSNRCLSTRATTNTSVATTKANARKTSTPRKQTSDRKPQSRGVSPMTRPRLPATLQGFSDEAPPNLITSVAKIQGRATSATRSRTGSATIALVEPKVENVKLRRQSCSPSVTRGRKVESGEQNSDSKTKANNSLGNGTLVMGSRMVERMMNARRRSSGGEEKDVQVKDRNQASEKPGIGRLMSKTSLDMALKKLEISKNPVGLKSSTQATSSGTCTKRSYHTTPTAAGRNFRNRTGSESQFAIKRGEGRIQN